MPQKSRFGLLRSARRFDRWFRARPSRATLFAALVALGVSAANAAPSTPSALVSIIIDDLGNSLAQGRRVIALPAPITLAILPHTTHSNTLAVEATRARKEVLLHLPMQPVNDAAPGPGVIEITMPAREIGATLDYDLSTVPHAIGVNNHMGSRVVQHDGAMRALLGAIRARGNLFFVDSRTSAQSVAARVGRELGLPILERDVFLDHDLDDRAIDARLNELVAVARRRGYAIGIGHPHAKTFAALDAWLATAASANIRVVPLSELLRHALKETKHGERAGTAGPGV